MLTCKDIGEKISSWIDGQLEPQESQLVSQHIEGCSVCQNKMALEKLTKKLVKEKLPLATAPAGLKTKILEQLGKESKPSPWWSNIFRPVPLASAFASLAVLFAVYTIWFSQPPVTNVATWWVCKAASYCHERDEQGKYTMDYLETNPQTMVQKVNVVHRRNFLMALPNYNPQKFSLTGCRFCELAKSPSIYVSLKREGHLVSLEIADATDIKMPRAKTNQVNGVDYFHGTYERDNVLIWRNGNLIYTVTSDLPEKDLAEIITPTYISEINTAHCYM